MQRMPRYPILNLSLLEKMTNLTWITSGLQESTLTSDKFFERASSHKSTWAYVSRKKILLEHMRYFFVYQPHINSSDIFVTVDFVSYLGSGNCLERIGIGLIWKIFDFLQKCKSSNSHSESRSSSWIQIASENLEYWNFRKSY